MMWLYAPLLAVLAIGVTAMYAMMRAVAYRFYRTTNEEVIIDAARQNTHFIETSRGMPSDLVPPDRAGHRRASAVDDRKGGPCRADLATRSSTAATHIARKLMWLELARLGSDELKVDYAPIGVGRWMSLQTANRSQSFSWALMVVLGSTVTL